MTENCTVITDWIKFDNNLTIPTSTYYRRIGELIEVEARQVFFYRPSEEDIIVYPQGLTPPRDLTKSDIEASSTIEFYENIIFLGQKLNNHWLKKTRFKSKIDGWASKAVMYHVEETIMVSFKNGIVVADTHNLYDAQRKRYTVAINGTALSYHLHCRTADKVKILVNGVQERVEVPSPANNYLIKGKIDLLKKLMAGDFVEFDTSNVFESGTIVADIVKPHASLTSSVYDNVASELTLAQVEYQGTIVKISTPGTYIMTKTDEGVKIEKYK